MTEIDYIEEQMASGEEWKASFGNTEENCRNLEDMIRRGLRHFEAIKSADQTWSLKVQAGEVPLNPDHVRTIRRAWEWWLAPCAWVLEQIMEMEEIPYEVAGADDLRRAWRYARSVTQAPLEDLLAD